MIKDKYAYIGGTIASPVTGAAGGTDFYYYYLDYSSITSGAELTNANFIWSTTTPTYNTTYRQWLGSAVGGLTVDDRCVFAVLVDGSNDIYEFYQDNGVVYYADFFVELAATDIDLTWTDLDMKTSIPSFARRAIAHFTKSTADSDFSWRTNGQTGANGHVVTVDSQTGMTADVITDGTQIIEIVAGADNTAKIGVDIEGWYFPNGM